MGGRGSDCARRSLRIALIVLCLLGAGAVVVARPLGPFGAAVARAQTGPPDCDNDGDPDTDQNEYGECYQPPPPPPHPFDQSQKTVFQVTILDAWNACAANGTPPPFPPQLPGEPAPTDPALQGALQTQYAVLSSLFLAICGPAGGIGAWAAQMLSIDPPDPLYSQVPMPQPMPAIRSQIGRCHKVKKRYRGACRRFALAALAYANDVSQEASLAEVMAIASNRFANAKQFADTSQEVADAAALEGYSGELARTLGALGADAKALATLIKRGHLDVHFSAKELGALRKGFKNLKSIPKWLVARINSDYLSTNEIKATLAQQLAHAKNKASDLLGLLRRQPSSAGLMSAWNAITLPQLAALVGALSTQGVVTPQNNIVLNDDLQNAQLACSPAERTTAVGQFVADAASKLSGAFSTLLQVGAQPLETYHPPASNTPPVASFTSFEVSPTEYFSDTSTDPDGGHIACRSWNFGDPGSGAANTSTDANPTHTYPGPGSYTVTLTVTDDDGFGTNTTSQAITVN